LTPDPNLADSRPGLIQRARNYNVKYLLRKAFRAARVSFFAAPRQILVDEL